MLIRRLNRRTSPINGCFMSVPNENDPVRSSGRVARDQAAFQQSERVSFQNSLVVKGARVTLLTVAQYVFLWRGIPREESPFRAGRECSSATAT